MRPARCAALRWTPRQEWCLSCGAAARTRLAAPTNWKAPIVAIAVIAALALAVLAAALVKLSGGSSTTTALAPVTRTITTTTPVFPGAIPTTTTTATGATGLGGVVAPDDHRRDHTGHADDDHTDDVDDDREPDRNRDRADGRHADQHWHGLLTHGRRSAAQSRIPAAHEKIDAAQAPPG